MDRIRTGAGTLFVVLALAAAQGAAFGQFKFRDVDAKSLELSENGSPVFVYNHGMMLKEGVPADRTRCCYVHPLYAPNGVAVTDDFPKDHFHHRGLFWIWAAVTVDGQSFDPWNMKGNLLDHFEKWNRKEAGKDQAVLGFQDGWYIGDRKVVEEVVEIVAHAAVEGRRDLDLTVSLRPIAESVTIAGAPEGNKGYGGISIRFAPRTATTIHTTEGADVPDSDGHPVPWAELIGDYGGMKAATRITLDAAHPGPTGWCLRHYGFVGTEYPGVKPVRLDREKPLVMKVRVTLEGR